jgi:hypothetical protein
LADFVDIGGALLWSDDFATLNDDQFDLFCWC